MVSRRGFIKGAVVAVVVVPGVARAGTKLLKGSVSYRERMALPPGATVTVQLLDVSLADAPAMKIAEVVITPEGQVPVPFEIAYDDGAIVPNGRYTLAARIEAGEQLLFINAAAYPVLTGGAEPPEWSLRGATTYEAPPSPAVTDSYEAARVLTLGQDR